MNTEKERKAFQKFCEENFDFEHHEHTYFDEQTQCYENDIGEDTESINMAWLAWQASANRGGYKFVPVEPTKEMITLGNEYYSESCSLSGLYKAMIGEETK